MHSLTVTKQQYALSRISTPQRCELTNCTAPDHPQAQLRNSHPLPSASLCWQRSCQSHLVKPAFGSRHCPQCVGASRAPRLAENLGPTQQMPPRRVCTPIDKHTSSTTHTGKQLGTAMCQMVMEYIPHACKNNMFDNYTTPLAETRSSGAGSSLAISDGGSSGFAVEAWLNLGERRACWQRFFWHAWEKNCDLYVMR